MTDVQSRSVITLSASGTPFWKHRSSRATGRGLAAVPPAVESPGAVESRSAVPTTPAGVDFDVSSAYDEHGASLFGFAINALGDRELAEDCVQETFLKAWRARESFDPAKASTRTWLFAIARNVIIDSRRSLQRMPKISDSADLADLADVGTDELERLRVLEALAKLSAEHRLAVVAVHLHGESYAELAARTGVGATTLRTRAFYGLRALREHLDTADDPHNDRSPS
ncbi:RNA polymerase sigma factor [Marisediminicola sp. LYQ85]|uniref:RNA polymerase sigma factor n=1 Tax=Marisediminicola sp. LYQ85 TaxID=3391062 RepID=UPI0039837389